ncbi:MAG: hypothetical protein EZS28_033002 [Streblomastix strix]|uniref:Uncharacterized protein n=1 Tax=Streblomastix strix TaxID=222440 RepID=A0A5J4UN09_9EUKA|nr:MAG: hypothetical protein EZS28_033002 [Streblomastix strix]
MRFYRKDGRQLGSFRALTAMCPSLKNFRTTSLLVLAALHKVTQLRVSAYVQSQGCLPKSSVHIVPDNVGSHTRHENDCELILKPQVNNKHRKISFTPVTIPNISGYRMKLSQYRFLSNLEEVRKNPGFNWKQDGCLLITQQDGQIVGILNWPITGNSFCISSSSHKDQEGVKNLGKNFNQFQVGQLIRHEMINIYLTEAAFVVGLGCQSNQNIIEKISLNSSDNN